MKAGLVKLICLRAASIFRLILLRNNRFGTAKRSGVDQAQLNLDELRLAEFTVFLELFRLRKCLTVTCNCGSKL
jgi:hypothetical protein